MEISAVMNIHELAVNKKAKEHAHEEIKKDQQGVHDKSKAEPNADDKETISRPGGSRRVVDPQSLTIRVESKQAAEQAKETVPRPEDASRQQTRMSVLGRKIDLKA